MEDIGSICVDVGARGIQHECLVIRSERLIEAAKLFEDDAEIISDGNVFGCCGGSATVERSRLRGLSILQRAVRLGQ